MGDPSSSSSSSSVVSGVGNWPQMPSLPSAAAFSGGLHFAMPLSSLTTTELHLVRGLLQILQGVSSALFYWDPSAESFCVRTGIRLTHLSLTSMQLILHQFTYAATCLRLVESFVDKIERSMRLPPTLRAFGCSVSTWLRMLRQVALREEEKLNNPHCQTASTLLGLSNSLSGLCSGAEHLLQIVNGAIPQTSIESDSIIAVDVAVHILDYLYKKLNEVCLIQGGEEDAYRMVLYVFVGSLFPYLECLDYWLFEGTLDDPFAEMFFYANKAITTDEAEFWEKSYLLRSSNGRGEDADYGTDLSLSTKDNKDLTGKESVAAPGFGKGKVARDKDNTHCPLFIKEMAKAIVSTGKSLQLIGHAPTTSNSSIPPSSHQIGRHITGLTLSETFSVSLAALIGHGNHISKYLLQEKRTESSHEPACTCLNKTWYQFLADTLSHKSKVDSKHSSEILHREGEKLDSDEIDEHPLVSGFRPENPAMTLCRAFLHENKEALSRFSLAGNFYLPSLDDEVLRHAIFHGSNEPTSAARNTNYAFGFQFEESEHLCLQEDLNFLEVLFPFPTILPTFQEALHVSEVLPFQKNSSLPSRVLSWILHVELMSTPQPVVLLQECLIAYMKKQADYVGRNILLKLLNDWRLIDELGVLRAIYLLGSGDLLQQFMTVIFSKLDKGETLDDEFELNTILQDSIRNSADSIILSTPDSLVVSITRNSCPKEEEQQSSSTFVMTPRRNRGQIFGLDGLDALKFVYKVSWPLELIANIEAMKKYNQVMIFLLKVRRAKFVLDKARRWMWKDRGTAIIFRKRHWLLEQKLLHFVDAFHQYVMDRVYHSAWQELCEGLAAAGSLDEVIEVHEAYLLSIQRQCFVVPDKLWAMIASRINSILGLALDFYSIQQTLSSGGAVSAMKARCEMELDQIERKFDDCILFLLRILSFKINVGQFPHLADLVTRINYNYFYMSENGSLTTAPSSDAVPVKSGRTFLVRPL